MSIPLIQDNNKDSINTSIIAIKRNIDRINQLLGLSDSGSSSDPDLSGLATKQELQDAVNSLQPVDEVTVDNMQSVTSNAVAVANSYSTSEILTGGKWIDGKPIYRKVITSNARTIYNNWNTVALDASVHTDYVIKCDMVSTSKNGTGGGVSANIKALVYADGTVHVNNQYSNVNNTVYCILEYTKTTD